MRPLGSRPLLTLQSVALLFGAEAASEPQSRPSAARRRAKVWVSASTRST
jgi:hypothetical protein